MVVCRRVFNLNEIATWFDRLTMSGCAPSNDRWGRALLAMTGVGFSPSPQPSPIKGEGDCRFTSMNRMDRIFGFGGLSLRPRT